MNRPRIGSMCSGYDGLALGLMDVIGGSVAWHCEIDPGANKATDEPVDNRSPLQASERAHRMIATSGRPSLTPLAVFAPPGSCSRTWQVMCLWGWEPYSGTLPRWGMTAGTELFELPTPAHPTAGSGYSSLLPTPKANEANGVGVHGNGGPEIRTAISLLPTPLASDGEKGGPNQRGGSGDLRLSSAVHHLLPTPTTADGTGEHKVRGGDRSNEMLLGGIAEKATLLPTPTSRDHKGANQRGDATCLHGALTNPPSPDGKASPADQLPGQLSLDDTANPD